jgi:sugar lactone lactonase YvrE
MPHESRGGPLGDLWRAFRWVLVPAAFVAAYLLFWPTGLDPYAWTPKPTPGTIGKSAFKPTQGLARALPLAGNLIADHYAKAGRPANFGPEDVAVGPRDSHVYTGLGDGRILRIDPRTGTASVFANTGGRPLGVSFTASGDRLYVADGHRGLLAVSPHGDVSAVVTTVDGEPVTFADNLDVAPDGTVWFSAPTREHSLEQVQLDVWESRPTGRLLYYDPRTGQSRKVLDNLFYANGVAVSDDGTFVLVAEFLAFRIQRYWIAGPRAGSHEVFIDNLPGYPDNITRTPDGTFLVGLSLARVPKLDAARPKPWLVKLIHRLPPSLTPKPQFPGYLLEFTRDGRLRRFIADETGGVLNQITAGTVLAASDGSGAGEIVVGSLLVDSVRRVPLDPARD